MPFFVTRNRLYLFPCRDCSLREFSLLQQTLGWTVAGEPWASCSTDTWKRTGLRDMLQPLTCALGDWCGLSRVTVMLLLTPVLWPVWVCFLNILFFPFLQGFQLYILAVSFIFLQMLLICFLIFSLPFKVFSLCCPSYSSAFVLYTFDDFIFFPHCFS